MVKCFCVAINTTNSSITTYLFLKKNKNKHQNQQGKILMEKIFFFDSVKFMKTIFSKI
jgi:hypothetical protein